MQNRLCNIFTFVALLAVIAYGLYALWPELKKSAPAVAAVEEQAPAVAPEAEPVNPTFEALDELEPLPPLPPLTTEAESMSDTAQTQLPSDSLLSAGDATIADSTGKGSTAAPDSVAPKHGKKHGASEASSPTPKHQVKKADSVKTSDAESLFE